MFDPTPLAGAPGGPTGQTVNDRPRVSILLSIIVLVGLKDTRVYPLLHTTSSSLSLTGRRLTEYTVTYRTGVAEPSH